MRRMLTSLIFMLIGAGGMYAAFEFHVIQSKKGWLFVPKSEAGLHDTYVDIRKWQATTWKQHPKLAQSLINDGKGNLIIQSAASNGFFDGLFQPSGKRRSASKEKTSTNRY